MNDLWKFTTIGLSLIVIGCFCSFVYYEREIEDEIIAYQSLLEDYKNLEKEKEITETAYKDVIINELKKVDAYIAWKDSLTTIHKQNIPDIEITDEDRQKFWENYFLCQEFNTTNTK